MADNIAITPGTGATAASDEIGGVHYQRAKLSLGADGSATDAVGGLGTVTSGVQRVTIATDDPASASLVNGYSGQYETVAAGQTAQVLGSTGAAGDYLASLLIVPATTSPGNVIIIDGSTPITVFTGGTVADLTPIHLRLNIKSGAGAWKVTTGSNVSVVAIGKFT